MAARSIWTGSLAFGLVNVPVKMYGAVTEKNVRFKQINGKTGACVKQKKVDAGTGAEVAFEDIVKGYELTPDHYITIDPAELTDVAPKKTGQISLEGFVDIAEIDPLIYDSSYYLIPDKGAGKAYKMLVKAMADSGRVGIGRVVLRSKEKLVAMRAKDSVLVCSTLAWADEINAPVEVDPADDPTEQELAMANMLIESLTVPFDHAGYSDVYREQVLAMIEAKAAGAVYTPQESADESAPSPDLMATLEASLAKTTKAAPKKAAAKKTKVAA